jgi:hypothetical protein
MEEQNVVVNFGRGKPGFLGSERLDCAKVNNWTRGGRKLAYYFKLASDVKSLPMIDFSLSWLEIPSGWSTLAFFIGCWREWWPLRPTGSFALDWGHRLTQQWIPHPAP